MLMAIMCAIKKEVWCDLTNLEKLHPTPFSLVRISYHRNQVLVECAVEVVGGREIPVAASGCVVDILWPRIDDCLALGIDFICDVSVRKRAQRGRANLVGRWIERTHVIRRCRQPTRLSCRQFQQ